MACVFTLLLIDHPIQQRLDLLIAILGVGRLIEIPTTVQPVDGHRQRLQVPHVGEGHFLRLSGQRHLEVITEPELWIGYLLPFIAEGSQTRPAPTPLVQGFADIVVLLAIGIPGYLIVPFQSQFPDLRQILILLDECIELILPTISEGLGGYDTGRPAVAPILIIGIKGFQIIAQLITHDVQQVIVENPSIDTMDHERRIAFVLHLGQPLTEGRCQLGALHLDAQLRIVRTDSPEYGLPDGLQHLVIGGLALMLHLLHGGLQRVGCDGCHHLRTQQTGLQQLTVVTTFRGFLHDLLKDIILRLRQVLIACRFHFLPERRIRLSEQHQWHDHYKQYSDNFLHFRIL